MLHTILTAIPEATPDPGWDWGGKIGEMFAALAFAGSLVATLAFYLAERSQDLAHKKSWEVIAKGSWAVHGISVVGIMGTLFYLIYAHRYDYHYVWSHSSNELPVYYMISCFWEGQEGSFLLWSFWHVVLGSILMFTAKKWRNPVMTVVSSVQVILASMLLGIYPESTFNLFGVAIPAGYLLIYLMLLGLPAAFLTKRFLEKRDQLSHKGWLHLGGVMIALMLFPVVLMGNAGFFKTWKLAQIHSVGDVALGLLVLALIAFSLLLLSEIILNIVALMEGKPRKNALNGHEALAAFSLAILGWSLFLVDLETWKIGSTPFLSMADAFPDAPIFQTNADFIPDNGKGLNPLLQNYWMVIHPPTLFLGFASTVVPFAYLVAGLWRKEMSTWIKLSAPWMIFSVMILGVGIIMGGYWAYETLNFGGYWNWDPVENSSLVPWIFGVAALHSLIGNRNGKSYHKRAMFFVASTFLLVLYSTFLTRSGILGETSVHTFTDLGLSGQLVALVFIYLTALIILVSYRLNDIPWELEKFKFWSKSNFLLLGISMLFLSGVVITLSTSMPVINKLFNKNLAPPADVQFFYYRWTIWFATWIGILSGVGTYIFWKRLSKKPLKTTIFWPSLIAIAGAILVIGLSLGYGWEFVYDTKIGEFLEVARVSKQTGVAGKAFMRWLFFFHSDELLLASSLFMVAANLIVLIKLAGKGKKVLLSLGGTLSHIGFGLMLVGIYFSSGFSDVLSINPNPEELAPFPEQDRIDNIFLMKNQPRFIKGYQVTYIGKKEAEGPISKVRVLEEDPQYFKAAFKDASNGDFYVLLPKNPPFTAPGSSEVNLEETKGFVEENLDILKPARLNERKLFGLKFTPWRVVEDYENLADTSTFYYDEEQDVGYTLNNDRSFTLYPESEANPGMGGMVSHPSRKIFLNQDVYVHVSSMPDAEEQEEKYEFFSFEMAIGDTAMSKRNMYIYEALQGLPAEGNFGVRAKAQIRVLANTGKEYVLEPIFRIDNQNMPSSQPAYSKAIETTIAFTDINPEKGTISVNVQEEDLRKDWVVIQAVKKPWINLLWLGTFVLTFGFMVAIVRRTIENRKTKRDA